jgi:hypothetical protein
MNGTVLVRDIAQAEFGLPLRAFRYVKGGFRAAQPAGAVSYDDGGNTPLLLGAMAVLALPEMAVLDLLLRHAAEWRIASDVVHAYGIVWALGLAHAFRTLPHVLGERDVTFRTLFFRTLAVPRDAIVCAEVVATDPRQARRGMRFGIGFRERAVRVTLRSPALVRTWLGRSQTVDTFLVAADDPARFARALAT